MWFETAMFNVNLLSSLFPQYTDIEHLYFPVTPANVEFDLMTCQSMRYVCVIIESDVTASFIDPDITNNLGCLDLNMNKNCAPGKAM